MAAAPQFPSNFPAFPANGSAKTIRNSRASSLVGLSLTQNATKMISSRKIRKETSVQFSLHRGKPIVFVKIKDIKKDF